MFQTVDCVLPCAVLWVLTCVEYKHELAFAHGEVPFALITAWLSMNSKVKAHCRLVIFPYDAHLQAVDDDA